eukprot:9446082-Alexandrium_andersonii.AAC.1
MPGAMLDVRWRSMLCTTAWQKASGGQGLRRGCVGAPGFEEMALSALAVPVVFFFSGGVAFVSRARPGPQ